MRAMLLRFPDPSLATGVTRTTFRSGWLRPSPRKRASAPRPAVDLDFGPGRSRRIEALKAGAIRVRDRDRAPAEQARLRKAQSVRRCSSALSPRTFVQAELHLLFSHPICK